MMALSQPKWPFCRGGWKMRASTSPVTQKSSPLVFGRAKLPAKHKPCAYRLL